MAFISTAINTSPVIAGQAGANMTQPAGVAVKFDANGNFVVAGAGEHAIGLVTIDAPDAVAAGDTLTVQVKDIGLWKAGGVIPKGAELTPDANGNAAVAAAGNFILAVALESASAAGQFIKVQIIKAGYKPSTV